MYHQIYKFNKKTVRSSVKYTQSLGGLGGRGHFLTVLISFRRKALYKGQYMYLNLKAKRYGFFLDYIIVNSLTNHI